MVLQAVSTLSFTSLVGPEYTLAFAERVPIIHIVGTPPTEQIKAKPLLHHTLGNGHFEAYSKAAEHFVVASAILSKPSTAGMEIDRVLVDCITKVAQPSDVSRGRLNLIPSSLVQSTSHFPQISSIPLFQPPLSRHPST